MFQLVIADFNPLRFDNAQHLKYFLQRTGAHMYATTQGMSVLVPNTWGLYANGNWIGWIDKVEV
jgi:hypothetical protein